MSSPILRVCTLLSALDAMSADISPQLSLVQAESHPNQVQFRFPTNEQCVSFETNFELPYVSQAEHCSTFWAQNRNESEKSFIKELLDIPGVTSVTTGVGGRYSGHLLKGHLFRWPAIINAANLVMQKHFNSVRLLD